MWTKIVKYDENANSRNIMNRWLVNFVAKWTFQNIKIAINS